MEKLNELIVEAEPRAQELFEAFIKESAEAAFLEQGKAMDGTSAVQLVIENAPQISVALAALIGTLQRRRLRFSIRRDGIELAIDGAAGAG